MNVHDYGEWVSVNLCGPGSYQWFKCNAADASQMLESLFCEGNKFYIRFFNNGRLHRLDGPAEIDFEPNFGTYSYNHLFGHEIVIDKAFNKLVDLFKSMENHEDIVVDCDFDHNRTNYYISNKNETILVSLRQLESLWGVELCEVYMEDGKLLPRPLRRRKGKLKGFYFSEIKQGIS